MTKNALGLWVRRKTIRRLDGRCSLAKAFKSMREGIEKALGGDLSPQQDILLDRAVFKTYKAIQYEARSLNGNDFNADSETYYLSWTNSIRKDLQALGLRRVPKEMGTLRQILEQDVEQDKGQPQ